MSFNTSQLRKGIYLVLLFGVVSLFSDMTYEGARSVAGPYLLALGAGAVAVGFATGFGEFLGYVLRYVSGHLADRTRRYWTLVILGYTISLFVIPALAYVGRWQEAIFLLILERLGKAIRMPARDALLSYATTRMGRGLGFGLHEAMDQIGALIGPLIVSAVLYLKGEYRLAFLVLGIPALFALLSLGVARFVFQAPESLEVSRPEIRSEGFSRSFWLYLLAMSLAVFGFANFPLIGYHLEKRALASKELIPILYALAMGVDAVSALILGYLYDRLRLKILFLPVVLSIGMMPLLFLGGSTIFIVMGMVLWGVGLSAQESIVRAAVADFVPKERRGQAFGTFHAAFGLSFFAGSLTQGLAYELSVKAMVLLSVLFQTLALLLLWPLSMKSSLTK